jgi:hypothetical protein
LELEEDKRDLERQVNELKAKIDQIEKRNAEQRAAEEKKHAEDITFYKKTNQQLKVIYCNLFIRLFNNLINLIDLKTQLEGIIAPKK